MKPGDRVKYTYECDKPGLSTWVTKYGEFNGLIKHTRKWKGCQLACIKFNGNEGISKVPAHKIFKITGSINNVV